MKSGLSSTRKSTRTGAAAIDVVITLAVLMVIAVSAYNIARISCANLYHVISVMTGYPYL